MSEDSNFKQYINKFKKGLSRYKNRFIQNSQVKIDEGIGDEITVTIPKTDWAKDPVGDIIFIIFIAWFGVLPMFLAVQLINIKEILDEFKLQATFANKFIVFIIFLVPFYILLSLYLGLAKDIFCGFHRIYINRINNTVIFYDSFSFRIFGIHLVKPKIKESKIDNTYIKLKEPFKFLGISIGRSSELYLVMDGEKIRFAEKRNYWDKTRIYQSVKKYLRQDIKV